MPASSPLRARNFRLAACSLLFFLPLGLPARAQPARLVADINPTSLPQESLLPEFLTSSGGRIFFWGQDPAHGSEVWVSDGRAGAALLRDINPGPAPADLNGGDDANETADLDGLLLFVAGNGSTGEELWRSDGTPAGTALLADLRPGPVSSLP